MYEPGVTPAPKNNTTKVLLIIGGVIVVLALGCCVSLMVIGALAPSTPTPSPVMLADGSTLPPPTEAAGLFDAGNDGSSRSKAAPLGATVSTDDMAFTITGLTDPADQIVTEASEYNGTPEPGKRYVMVSLTILCQAVEKCDFGLYNLKMVGSEGISREYESVSDVPDLLESTEFFNGAKIKGNVVYQMGQDETDLVLTYSVFLSPDIYLATR